MISLQPTLSSQQLLLRPLLKDDFEALYQAASDPLIWAGHPSPLRYQRESFTAWFEEALLSKGALIVIDHATHQVIGTSRYYDYQPDERQIAIGYTFLSRMYWGGATNAELKRMMLAYAFEFVDKVYFHIAPSNLRSQKAIEKIGATLSHQAVKQLTGPAQTYLFYSIAKP